MRKNKNSVAKIHVVEEFTIELYKPNRFEWIARAYDIAKVAIAECNDPSMKVAEAGARAAAITMGYVEKK